LVKEITGIAYWAKVFNLIPAYNQGEKEWSIDVSLDAENKGLMVMHGLEKGIKNKGDARGDFYTFKRRELKKKTNQPNQPIGILGPDGKKFEGTSIGNGSLVKVRFNVFTVPAFGKSPAHNKDAILQVQVLELVEYKRPEEGSTQTATSGGETWKTEGEVA
jgi:hypothetical protein